MVGDGRAEGSSAIGDSGQAELDSNLMLMAQARPPCWN